MHPDSSQLNLERVNVQPFPQYTNYHGTMASADFSANFRLAGISPGKALILKVYAGAASTRKSSLANGLYKDVVAYPLYRASYAVPVRPYRLL